MTMLILQAEFKGELHLRYFVISSEKLRGGSANFSLHSMRSHFKDGLRKLWQHEFTLLRDMAY